MTEFGTMDKRSDYILTSGHYRTRSPGSPFLESATEMAFPVTDSIRMRNSSVALSTRGPSQAPMGIVSPLKMHDGNHHQLVGILASTKHQDEKKGGIQMLTPSRFSSDSLDTLDSAFSLSDHHDRASRLPHASPPEEASELSTHFSALYLILVTMTGFLLAVSPTLTTKMDPNLARWFDFTLMSLGILWMLFSFVFLFRKQATCWKLPFIRAFTHKERFVKSDMDSGSFYLKLGATLFAVGSVIYSCLQLGVFVENRSCFNVVMGLTPCVAILFVLMQLYFIFKNSQFKITRFRGISRFGLAHLMATDLCIWMRTLIDETLLEFEEIEKGINKTIAHAEETGQVVELPPVRATIRTYRAGALGYNPVCVNQQSSVQEMMGHSTMFLFPCIIEYALICAGIMFVMWKVIGTHSPAQVAHGHIGHGNGVLTRNHKVFTVDCSHAANGLFASVLVVVLTIVGLITYFILVDQDEESEEHTSPASALLCDIMVICLSLLGLGSSIYCGYQFSSKLQRIHIHTPSMALDDGLLLITMVGVYGFSVIWLLSTFNQTGGIVWLDITSSLLEIIQTTAQTAFLFDAGKRVCVRRVDDHNKKVASVNEEKPAREVVMFLIGVNFSQWAVNILLTMRADAAPGPRNFYGVHQWAVLLHTTVPLAIFYRFHSTVCLFDIWKRAYKIRPAHHHATEEHHQKALAIEAEK